MAMSCVYHAILEVIRDRRDVKYKPNESNNNEYLHKYSALEILERINKGEKTELVDPTEGDRPLV